MNSVDFNILNEYLRDTGDRIRRRLGILPFLQQLGAGPIQDRLLDYVVRGGKNLRPALTMMACGAVGGNPDDALDIGIAIEITHTWTLVHDDIIDRDDSRRNGPSVHARIREDYADWELNNPGMTVDHLALSMALLVGDAQHAMAMEIMARAGRAGIIPADLVLYLIAELEGAVLPALLTGEVDDVFQTGIPLGKITRDEILLMLQRKTAALLTYSVTAGGMIGLGIADPQHPMIHSLRTYSDNLGIAFQLRDDILGIEGDEIKLGKPVGSDFREGKRTLAVKIAWDNGSGAEKTAIESLLGKPELTMDEVNHLRHLVESLGGIEAVSAMASHRIETALAALEDLPRSRYRDILAAVADYTIRRRK
ncbi:MAG TPA: polyprenyl synthetase family protein [bacterium]|nr:polyprenyl synthetase family protein [bacterium]